ncbi:hypothetical protein VMUT_0692 [Vulcanisaeta moutnovskia 768-28]|uniref:TIGR00304 family protein n=1 Tax=Vulcanisaeta moutnovskia (strain 768-28) TaxID=985053 RepID=F0QVX9_VULM7|nr:DUF131 domain-containing protein [Vulcanisaeta moutnovskia]ADY00903.1 hypothetical protein VMUT_0692 [Vulcanisaeta moutnovskia 768-28]
MNITYIIGLAIMLSIILALLGIVLIVIDVMRSHKEDEDKDDEKKGKSSVGGVVLIGPIPIVFGNDPSIIKWAIVLTIIVVILFIVLALLPGIL